MGNQEHNRKLRVPWYLPTVGKKKVLLITSETGLLGKSHFFISFNGNNKDVIVPPELKSEDNSEIKIIIQHQFWELKPLEDHFEVTLSFNGQKKKI